MIVEALAGRREVHIEEDHSSQSYAKIIAHIAESMYGEAKRITIVEDNLSAHKLSALYQIMDASQARAIINRIQVVRTPKHGSCGSPPGLNIAEAELSVLIRCGLKKRTPDKETLQQDVKAWYERRNEQEKKVNWQFRTKDARIKLKHLYPLFTS